MKAEQRALELINAPISDVPNLAYEYVKYILSSYGRCGEIFIKAFSHYAQAIENLSCEDIRMEIDEEGKRWFRDREDKK